MENKISVIMPAYNERNLFENVLEVKKSLSSSFKNFEIIVVNDGSDIRFHQEFENLKKIHSKNIHLISYPKNVGKSYALKQGFLNSKGDFIVFLDSGLELSPDHIKEFYEILKKCDVVIGSKRHKNSELKYPMFRRLMSFFYQKLIRILFNLNLKDTQVGIKMFKREVLSEVMPKMLVKKYAFDIELLALAEKKGFKIVEAPIKMNFKLESNIKPSSVANMIVDTFAVFYRLKVIKYYDKKKNE